MTNMARLKGFTHPRKSGAPKEVGVKGDSDADLSL